MTIDTAMVERSAMRPISTPPRPKPIMPIV